MIYACVISAHLQYVAAIWWCDLVHREASQSQPLGGWRPAPFPSGPLQIANPLLDLSPVSTPQIHRMHCRQHQQEKISASPKEGVGTWSYRRHNGRRTATPAFVVARARGHAYGMPRLTNLRSLGLRMSNYTF
jgi:hypothetical protein